MRKKLSFLAIAFRELSCNANSNFMSLDQFRRVLSGQYIPASSVDECFASMGPDAKGHIHLDQWLDALPLLVVQRLHSHPKATNWRDKAQFTNQEAVKARRPRGSPYI